MNKDIIALNGIIMFSIIKEHGNGNRFLNQEEYIKASGKINIAKKHLDNLNKQ